LNLPSKGSLPLSDEISTLSLSGLRHRCAEESDRFFRRQGHDPRFCFELFRRAVSMHDQQAWEIIYAQYQPLVSSWVERHALFSSFNEETQFFVNWAFEKMWTAVTPEKFAGFPDLKAVLRYLQMCVHSVMVDFMRSHERAALLEDEAQDQPVPDPNDKNQPEIQAFERTQGEALWRWLQGKLKDEKERCVVYGSFILDLKPGELHDYYRNVFMDVKEIYKIKDNVLARLKRDEELRQYFSDFQ
jgi:DNA-directed RNA polymerase specialized sigma24 family protein